MDGTLNLSSNTLAYADVPATSNPSQKFVDWSMNRSYQVSNPKSEPFTVDPGATLSLFSGIRATGIDNTTELQLTLSPLANTRYRFTWTGTGTTPGFRTGRTVALATRSVTMTVNANLTLSMAAQAGDFAAVVVGDTLLIPDTSTGDPASPFNPINTGYWVVLSKDGTSTTLQLTRPSGQGFVGITETVTVVSNPQVLVYSAAGVQVGDKVNISGGFPASVQNTYQVVAVTATWFEITAMQPLPTGISAVPNTGIKFYTGGKRYIRFVADQECYVQLNGDTGTSNRISPWVAADPANAGTMEKCGPCWSASVTNLSTAPLNFLFISAE